MKERKKIEDAFISDSNSGAHISIISIDSLTLIKKSEKLNLDRFQSNITKQEIFLPIGPFKPAAIYSQNKEKNNMDLIMPFYNGISGSNYSKKITLEDIDFLLDSFLIYFKNLKAKSVQKKVDGKLLIKKCNSVNTGIKRNNFFSKDEKYFLSQQVINLKESIKPIYIYPHSTCHGDFTLSNIIYNKRDRDLILIDFLDTYISSYLIDIAKIKQDLVHGWSFRREPRTVRMKAMIMGMHVYEKIYLTIDQSHKDLFKVVDSLNALRIAPYIKDDHSKEWLLEVLTK